MKHPNRTIRQMRALRIFLGLTQAQVAKRLGITQAVYGQYEVDNTQMPYYLQDRLDEYLDSYSRKCAPKVRVPCGPKRNNISYSDLAPWDLATPEDIERIKIIMRRLEIPQLHLAIVIGDNMTGLSARLTGNRPMLKAEYNAAMRLFKNVKLKRIFGDNPFRRKRRTK